MNFRTVRLLAGVLLACSLSLSAAAQKVTVDVSACKGMHEVLLAMKGGAPRAKASAMLDALMAMRPYEVMFRHYNRSWRPNHLPVDVFKRMILSLQYEGAYKPGENPTADKMRARWATFYPDLARYEARLKQLEAADLKQLVRAGVGYAQGWLPEGWEIPDFYLAVIPNGGSSAFAIQGAQGYDFLQLEESRPGRLDVDRLVGTIAHESHHLGMRFDIPEGYSPADAMAYRVVGMCLAEGAATEFVSGPPPGRAPAVPDLPYHILDPEACEAWRSLVAEEGDILRHQVALLDRAAAGKLTKKAFNDDLFDYWIGGAIGRVYVLGADMLGAIYLAYGKQGVFSVMEDPRKLFQVYNAALDKRPKALRRCVRVPKSAAEEAMAIGRGSSGNVPTGR